jgi:hypothetical protein
MGAMSEATSDTESGALKSAISMIRDGAILLGVGSLIIILIHLRASRGKFFLLKVSLLLLMALGFMVFGYVRGRRHDSAQARRRLHRIGAAGLAVLAIGSGGMFGTWMYRARSWSAAEALVRGDDAAQKLRTIGERHAAKMEAGAAGPAALDSWKESAAEALSLRADFAEAAEAALYLREAGGSLRERAVIDAQFYPLCLEWLDLYAAIQSQIQQESLAEPPVEWEIGQERIVERIQALPPLPEGGS